MKKKNNISARSRRFYLVVDDGDTRHEFYGNNCAFELATFLTDNGLATRIGFESLDGCISKLSKATFPFPGDALHPKKSLLGKILEEN